MGWDPSVVMWRPWRKAVFRYICTGKLGPAMANRVGLAITMSAYGRARRACATARA
jgi:hypothetical protein